MKKKWFITGTDTNVGKTIVASIMLIKASKIGFHTAGYKPIATGCIKTKKGLRNSDALLLRKYSIIQFKYNTINPFLFYEHQPPHLLSKSKKIIINYHKLSYGLHVIQKKSNWVIIEGAGGWYTPLSDIFTFSDWIKQENIPVILVVGLKLGCINHAILTGQAIIKSGVKFSGWFANCLSYEEKYFLDYIHTIKLHIHAPFLGKIPFMNNVNNLLDMNINITLPI